MTAYTVAQLVTMHNDSTEIACTLTVMQQDLPLYAPVTTVGAMRCVEIEAPAGSEIVRPPDPGFTDVTTVRVIIILASAHEIILA